MIGPGSDKNSVEMTRTSSTPIPQNSINTSGHIPGGEMNNTCVITIIVYMWIINDQQKDAKDAPIIWTLLASLLLVGEGS